MGRGVSGSSVPLPGEPGLRRPLLLCPHRLGISSCPFQALARFPKSRRVRRRGRGGEFHRHLFGQRSPSAVITQTGREPHVGRAAPTRTENACGPAASRPRCSASVPGRRSQAGAASVGPSPRPGARSAEAAPHLRPDSPRRRRRLPAYMAPSVPRSPARKGCPPRRRPNSLRN